MDRLTDVGYIPERVVANMTTEQLASIYRKLCEYENTELEPQDVPDVLEMCKIKMALDNLAEYQETNLSPEQIKAIDKMYLKKCQKVNKLTERLKRYKALEELGRMVELPCAVGDIVYEVQMSRKRIQPFEITSVNLGRAGTLFFNWRLKNGTGIYNNLKGFGLSQLGKTVFLTREEAEMLLEGYQEC